MMDAAGDGGDTVSFKTGLVEPTGGSGGGGSDLSDDMECRDGGRGGVRLGISAVEEGGEAGDLPPLLFRALGGGGFGLGVRSLDRRRSSPSSNSLLVLGVSSGSPSAASGIGSKIDCREVLLVSVELSGAATSGVSPAPGVGGVEGELWPVSISRLKASASSDCRPDLATEYPPSLPALGKLVVPGRPSSVGSAEIY